MSIRIFLVDDHEIVRRGVADLFEDEPDLEIVGEAATVSEALARIPALAVDVAVLDVRMPDGNGVELCRDLRSQLPLLGMGRSLRRGPHRLALAPELVAWRPD